MAMLTIAAQDPTVLLEKLAREISRAGAAGVKGAPSRCNRCRNVNLDAASVEEKLLPPQWR